MSLRHRAALWALAATIFAIPWQEAIIVPGIGSVARVVGSLALILTIFSTIEPGGVRMRAFSPLLLVAGLYVGWTILSFFWTVDLPATRETISTHVQLLLFVWAFWQLSKVAGCRRFLAQAFVLGSYVTAINIIFVFLYHSDQINIDGRTTALGENQNDVAAVMAIALAIAWWLTTYRRGWILTLINLLYLPIGLFAIILTGSRGGTVAAALALVAIPLTLKQVRPSMRVLVAFAIVGAVAGTMALPKDIRARAMPALHRVSETPQMVGATDLTGRTEIWRAGYRALVEKPIIGYGGDAFPSAVKRWLGYAKSAHNSFLSVAVNTGLIGVTLFGLMLITVFAGMLRQPASASKTTEIIIFGVLFVSMLPLGWEYYKTTWFVMALLSATPVRSAFLAPATRRLRPEWAVEG